ncbi:hypothetical protein TSOC_009700, partial [Tetrabaena socialis]
EAPPADAGYVATKDSDPGPAERAAPPGVDRPAVVTSTTAAPDAAPAPVASTADAVTTDTGAVELDDQQEARDSLGNLPPSGVSSSTDASAHRFGGIDVPAFEPPPMLPEGEHSHFLLQRSLPQVAANNELETRAAGLKHIGFGPLKKENQDEYFVQVGGYGGQKDGCCYCIFDGQGHQRNRSGPAEGVGDPNAKELLEPIISDAFVETERRLHQAGVNVSSSGTTASVVFQNRSSVWVAAAGDSRV